MNSAVMLKNVSELKSWVIDQPHLPKLIAEDEELLKAFCINCSIQDLAKLKIDAYFALRGQYREFFHNRDPKKIRWYTVRRLLFLPSSEPEGDHVLLTIYPGKEKLKCYSPEETIKLTFMLLDSYIREFNDKRFNLYIINDMSTFSDEIGENLAKEYSQQCSEIIEAYPIRLKGIISFNASPQAEEFCRHSLKHFCQENNRKKIFIEKDDHQSLAKYIPLEMLPSNYQGGNNLPIKALWDSMKQKLEREREWFLSVGKQTTNESCRI